MALVYLALASIAVLQDLAVPRGRSSYFNRDAVAWMGQAWALQCGQLSGRDFISTYGAGAQVLARAAVRLNERDDFLSSPPRIDAVFRWTGVALCALLLVLWSFERARQAAAAAVLWWTVGLPWNYAAMRPASACVALLVAERLLRRDPWRCRWAPFVAGAICLLPAALTPDMSVFLLSVVILLAALRQSPHFSDGPMSRPLASAALASGLVALGFLATLVLVETLFVATTARGGAADFGSFAAETWRMMATCSLSVGKTWDARNGSGFAVTIFVLATLAVLALSAGRCSPGQRSRWLALALFCLSGLPGGLIRSDPAHLALGLTPMALAVGLAAPQFLVRRASLVWGFAVLMAMASWPIVAPSLSWQRLVAVGTQAPSAAWSEVRRGGVPGEPFPGGVLRAARARQGPLFVYPWQNHLGPASGRCFPQRIDQTYKAHDLELQRRQVLSLARAGSGLSVWARLDQGLDRVQDSSRSPVMVEYLLEAFEPTPHTESTGPWIELQRRQRPRVLPWRAVELPEPENSGTKLRYRLREPVSCGLLRLGLRLDYAGRLSGLKSQRLEIRLRLGESALLASTLVPLNADGRFDTLLATRRGESISGVFEDPIRLTRVEFDQIELEPEPGDLWTRELVAASLGSVGCL